MFIIFLYSSFCKNVIDLIKLYEIKGLKNTVIKLALVHLRHITTIRLNLEILINQVLMG